MTMAVDASPVDGAPTTSGIDRFARAALLVLVVVTVSNASEVLVGFPVPLYSLVLVLASVSLVLCVVTKRVPLRIPGVVFLFAVTLALMVPAVMVAPNGQAAWAELLARVKELWFLAVVVLLGSTVAGAMTLARTLTAVMSVLAALAMLNEYLLGNGAGFGGFSVVSESLGVGTDIPRQAGPFEDPNFFGRLLVLTLPLSFTLIAHGWTRRARGTVAAWSLCAVLLVGGVYLTGSRGAMLGVVFVSVVWMSLAGPPTRRALILIPALLVVAALLPGVGSRLVSLSELSPDSPTFAERDGSLVERTAAAHVMWSVFSHNPVLGVGPGNVSTVWQQYATAGGGGISRQVAPHNFFLQVLGETGVVGMLGWLIFLLGTMAVATRAVQARSVAPPAPPGPERLLAIGGIASVTGWVVTSFFLHLALLKIFLVVIAIIGIISMAPGTPATVAGPRTRMTSRLPVIGAIVCVWMLAAALGYRSMRPEQWVTDVPVTLVPAPGPGGERDAYRQYLTERRLIVATYAALVDRLGRPLVPYGGSMNLSVVAPRISSGSSVESFFIVRVEGADRQRVRALALRVADRGDEYVHSEPFLSSFATTAVGPAASFPAGGWSLTVP
jgi:O-antigen ligase